jgi:hypothetical protein
MVYVNIKNKRQKLENADVCDKNWKFKIFKFPIFYKYSDKIKISTI